MFQPILITLVLLLYVAVSTDGTGGKLKYCQAYTVILMFCGCYTFYSVCSHPMSILYDKRECSLQLVKHEARSLLLSTWSHLWFSILNVLSILFPNLHGLFIPNLIHVYYAGARFSYQCCIPRTIATTHRNFSNTDMLWKICNCDRCIFKNGTGLD